MQIKATSSSMVYAKGTLINSVFVTSAQAGVQKIKRL
jgi:hypothetical protein